MGGPEREVPALAEVLVRAPLAEARRIVLDVRQSGQLSLAEMLAGVPAQRADEILASLPEAPRPARAPAVPPAAAGEPPAVLYRSWEDYLARTTSAQRRQWCAAMAAKANRFRLTSGHPETTITADDVLAVLEEARGRCGYCGSLAVEPRPPGPWGEAGRRIGSLGHRAPRFTGASTLAGLAWCCMWCNTWPEERIAGATDHGGYFP